MTVRSRSSLTHTRAHTLLSESKTYSIVHSKCALTINEMVIQLLMEIFPIHAALRVTQLGQLYMNLAWIKMSSTHTLTMENKPKCTLLSYKNILSQLIIRHRFSNSVSPYCHLIALKTTLHYVSTYSLAS